MKLQNNRIIISDSKNTHLNLAFEDKLLEEDTEFDMTLFLWQSKNSVVIGSNQNPWRECDICKLKRDGVMLARRLTGGGAVYQDEGNINFSFIAENTVYDEKKQLKVIINALKNLGIESSFSGRNDILVNGRKISGNAYFYGEKQSMHHGTILISSNIDRLFTYLTPSDIKLKSKGVDSVSSRVINLKELNEKLNVEIIKKAILSSFIKTYGMCETSHISEDSLKDSNLKEIFDKYSSWNWIYGESPLFELIFEERFEWGEIQISAALNDASFTTVEIFSDALDVGYINRLRQCLVGVKYNKEDIEVAFSKICKSESEKKMNNNILNHWFS